MQEHNFFFLEFILFFFSFEFPRLVLKMPQKVPFYTREDVLGPNNDLKRPFGGEAQICAKEKSEFTLRRLHRRRQCDQRQF